MEERAQVEELKNESSGKVLLPPCQVACPIGENIQRTNVMISQLPLDTQQAASKIIQVGDEIYEKNPLFAVCGYVCGLCEKECNYKDETGAVRRRMLKRFVSDYYLSYLETKSAFPAPTKEKIAVIGGGPGGLMCAYVLGQQGYQVTVFERSNELGGALRWIPKYRLPKKVLDASLNNMMRIANVKVEFGTKLGSGGKALSDLKKDGYKAIFVATGTTEPRPLTFDMSVIAGAQLSGVMFGLNLLSDLSDGKVPSQFFQGKKVLVIGGGNVAFDAARTAKRLGGDIAMFCLENSDKSSKDGIPADEEEIEGAMEEGIEINYSRGVSEIIGEGGKFQKIKCPQCVSVFDENGRFNPKFDESNTIYPEGDIVLITIGQGPDRAFFRGEKLLNDQGRFDMDPLTMMSNLQEGIFIGGDARRIGFAADAMKDGTEAAESIKRYLNHEDIKSDREKEYESAPMPKLQDYKPQPDLVWAPPSDRMNFDIFEHGLTLTEAIEEGKRCLECGPCKSCKGCVILDLQDEIPDIEVNKDLCSGCKICVSVCPYEAVHLKKSDEQSVRYPLREQISDSGLTATIDDLQCKRCSICVTACPTGAIKIANGREEIIKNTLASI
ncbi:FAD-dependent oxidoreductase [Chloroflexota bacterium]